MARMKLLLAVAIMVSGCYSLEQQRVARAEKTAVEIDCPAARIQTTEPVVTGSGITGDVASNWMARGCGREYACRMFEPKPFAWKLTCEETPKSQEATATKVAIDRLAVETGCPAKRIKPIDTTGWVRGKERSYAMLACGKRYTCTTSPSGTDCKKSLAEAASDEEDADAPSKPQGPGGASE